MDYSLGYMPHIEGNWTADTQYTPMAIVKDNGKSYISKVAVAANMRPGVTSGWGNYWQEFAEGIQGYPGANGAQGAAGTQGADGTQGATGVGTQGAAGIQGETGARGPQGLYGGYEYVSYLDNNVPGVTVKPGMSIFVPYAASDFRIDFAIQNIGDMSRRPSRLLVYFGNYTVVHGYSSVSGQPVRINDTVARDYFENNKIKPGYYLFDFVDDGYTFIIQHLYQATGTIQPY